MRRLEDDYVCFEGVVHTKALLMARHLRGFSKGRRALFSPRQYSLLFVDSSNSCYLLSNSSMIPQDEKERHRLAIGILENYLSTNPNGKFPKDAKIL